MKPSPLKFAAQPCNKTIITVCKNSMQLRWGMEIRINDSTFVGYDDGVFIEYISYNGDPNVSTATIRLSEFISNQLVNGTEITFHGDRGLNFHPDRKITGLNVIDKMIFWTDNHSEPKKINIERGKLGSLSSIYGAGFDGSSVSPLPYTWNGTGTTCRGGLTMPDGSPSLACFSDFDQHTKLIVLDKHTMDCEKSTLDCDIFGCTDMTAINWNPAANTDDGSCILPIPPVYGCDNGTYGVDNTGACNIGGAYWNLTGPYFSLPTGGGGGAAVNLSTPNTLDYNTNDSSLCIFAGTCELCDPITGNTILDPSCSDCIDTNATNAGGGSLDCLGNSGGTNYSCCNYCLDITASNYYPGANDCSGVAGGADYAGCCVYLVSGCTDPIANNYNFLAVLDDGSCTYSACVYQGTECYLGDIHEVADASSITGGAGITEEQIDSFYRFTPMNTATSRDYWIDHHRSNGSGGTTHDKRKGIKYTLRFNTYLGNSSNTISRAKQAFSMFGSYCQTGNISNTTDQRWFNLYGAPTNGVENKGIMIWATAQLPYPQQFYHSSPYYDPSGDYQAGVYGNLGLNTFNWTSHQWGNYESTACNQNDPNETGLNTPVMREKYDFMTRATLINFLNYLDLYVSDPGYGGSQPTDQLAHDAPLATINTWLRKETGWWSSGDFNGMGCGHLEIDFACGMENTLHSAHADYVGGCMDATFSNYNPLATANDCSCNNDIGL